MLDLRLQNCLWWELLQSFNDFFFLTAKTTFNVVVFTGKKRWQLWQCDLTANNDAVWHELTKGTGILWLKRNRKNTKQIVALSPVSVPVSAWIIQGPKQKQPSTRCLVDSICVWKCLELGVFFLSNIVGHRGWRVVSSTCFVAFSLVSIHRDFFYDNMSVIIRALMWH